MRSPTRKPLSPSHIIRYDSRFRTRRLVITTSGDHSETVLGLLAVENLVVLHSDDCRARVLVHHFRREGDCLVGGEVVVQEIVCTHRSCNREETIVGWTARFAGFPLCCPEGCYPLLPLSLLPPASKDMERFPPSPSRAQMEQHKLERGPHSQPSSPLRQLHARGNYAHAPERLRASARDNGERRRRRTLDCVREAGQVASENNNERLYSSATKTEQGVNSLPPHIPFPRSIFECIQLTQPPSSQRRFPDSSPAPSSQGFPCLLRSPTQARGREAEGGGRVSSSLCLPRRACQSSKKKKKPRGPTTQRFAHKSHLPSLVSLLEA